MTASEVVKALEDDPRFKRENQRGVAQISEEKINKFEQMSVDEQLQLTGEDKIALTEYYKYKKQNRQQQIKSNEIELHSFYEEVRATGLDTDYYRGIEDSQLNKSVIQIILKHLDKDYSRDALQILIDKLQSSKARGMAGAKLIKLYKKADNSLRFYIAQTLEKVATKNELNDILSIFNNPKISDEGKDYLPLIIAKIMGKQAIPILIQVVEEKTGLEQSNLLLIMCIEALGKLHAVEAKELIEPYTKHQDTWYQNQAKKALRKINTTKQVATKLPTGIKLIKDNKIKCRYEAAIELDMENISDFLKRLGKKINANPQDLERLILDTELEETKTYELKVKKYLKTEKLYFQVFMDDINVVALYFFSLSQPLIRNIAKIIDNYVVNDET